MFDVYTQNCKVVKSKSELINITGYNLVLVLQELINHFCFGIHFPQFSVDLKNKKFPFLSTNLFCDPDEF